MTDQPLPEEQQLAQLSDELEDLLDQVEAKRKQIKELREKISQPKQPHDRQDEPRGFNPTTETTATPASVEAKNGTSTNSTPKTSEPELPKFTGPEVDYIMEALVDSPNKSKHKSTESSPEKQTEDTTNNNPIPSGAHGTTANGNEANNTPIEPAIKSSSPDKNTDAKHTEADKGAPPSTNEAENKVETKPTEGDIETSDYNAHSEEQTTATDKSASKTRNTKRNTTDTTPKSPSKKTTAKPSTNDSLNNNNKRSSTAEPTPVSAPKKAKPNPRQIPIPASDKSKRQKWFQTVYDQVKDEFKMRRRISIFLKTRQQVEEYRELREQGKDDDAFFSPILNLSGDKVLIKQQQQQHQTNYKAENKTNASNNLQGGRSSRRRGASTASGDEAKWGSSAEAAAFMLDATIPAASVEGYLYAVPFEVYAGSPRGPDFNMARALEEGFPPLKGPWTEELLTVVLDGVREQIHKKRTKRVD